MIKHGGDEPMHKPCVHSQAPLPDVAELLVLVFVELVLVLDVAVVLLAPVTLVAELALTPTVAEVEAPPGPVVVGPEELTDAPPADVAVVLVLVVVLVDDATVPELVATSPVLTLVVMPPCAPVVIDAAEGDAPPCP